MNGESLIKGIESLNGIVKEGWTIESVKLINELLEYKEKHLKLENKILKEIKQCNKMIDHYIKNIERREKGPNYHDESNRIKVYKEYIDYYTELKLNLVSIIESEAQDE